MKITLNDFLNEKNNLDLLDKKGKRLSDDKYLNFYFSGTLIKDIKKWLKSGDTVYFKFHNQPAMRTGVYFSLFNEYTSKSNIPISNFDKYIKNPIKVNKKEYDKTYNDMFEKDFDTYSIS